MTQSLFIARSTVCRTALALLSVAALACTIIPPLQAAAPFLGAAATAIGAIDTYKSCKAGAALDCAMGLTDLVPGAVSSAT